MNIQQIIKKLINHENLTAAEMTFAMQEIMAGKVTPAQIAGFLVALHIKGETADEIAAAAKVIRQLALPVKVSGKNLVDIVGTGGDQSHLFNVSTTSAFVVAAAGAQVAKHNNRSLSSASGSADLLEAAGININLTPEQIANCINQTGIGFMFAPLHHLSWKYSTPVRRELGTRTIFNLLGPLANPANVPNLFVGVFAKHWLEPIAEAFLQLGNQHVLVAHSEDGLDEISIAAPTQIAELKAGKITTYTITPEQFGIKRSSLDKLRVNNAQESLAIMESVFNNEPGPARDIVVLNAGAAIYVANLVNDLANGVKKADEVIANGKAKEKFNALKTLAPL